MKYYQKARKIAESQSSTANLKRAEKAIERIGKKQDEEKNVDFYEVLNLTKPSSISQIKAAYKKAVVQWHPDRFRDPIKKREAERKMKNINRAYDVLSDPEKKRIYDMGQDPDNPGAGAGFQEGGFPGGFHGGFPGGFGGFPGGFRVFQGGFPGGFGGGFPGGFQNIRIQFG